MTDHTIAHALVAAQKAHKRKPADFYPTPPEVTRALMDELTLINPVTIWEPACGDGAMSEVIQSYGHEVTSTDLRPDGGYGQGGVDFLDINDDLEVDWIITNPPFNLAENFIRQALRHTPNVAMLLSNQYWHAKGRLALFEDHPPAYVYPLTWRPAFLEKERGKSPMMNVMWVVWRKNALDVTQYKPLCKPVQKSTKSGTTMFEDILG